MALPSKSLKELSPRHQQLFERALSSYRAGDARAAAEILAGIVQEEPGCADVRKSLRAAQLELVPEPRGGLLGCCRRLIQRSRIQLHGKPLVEKGRHEEALALAEAMLAVDPRSRSGLLFLATAAEKAGVPKIAEDALELSVKLYADNPRCWRALADHSLKYGHGRRALAALRTLRGYFPDDVELRAEINQAKAAAVMDVDSWEKVSAARDPVPEDTPVAVEDGQASARDVRQAQDRAHRQKADSEQTADASPAASRLPSKPANRHLKAQLMLKRRRQAAAAATPAAVPKPDAEPLSEREFSAELAKLDGAVDQWRIYGRTHPDKREDADREISAIQKTRHDLSRKHCEDRLAFKPDDLHTRFELGCLLMEDNEWDYAMEQFQATRRDPDMTAESLANLGRCMARKGLQDLAAIQFEAALEAGFDDDEQALLSARYDLADLYEELGKREEAARLLKDIYAADITFRDVSFRVERLYAGGNEALPDVKPQSTDAPA